MKISKSFRSKKKIKKKCGSVVGSIRMAMSSSTLSIALGQKDWSSVIQQVRNNKHTAKVWAKPGIYSDRPFQRELKKHVFGLPIHEAIYLGAPFEVIHALAMAYPKSLKKKEKVLKRTPLHLATMQKPMNEDVVLLLMKLHEDAIDEPDKDWRTPFHHALENPQGCSDRLIMKMLELKPNVPRAIDKQGFTPLHLACSSGYPIQILHTLLKEYPEASLLLTAQGRSAGHFYVTSNKENNEKQIREVLEVLEYFKSKAEDMMADPLERSQKEAEKRYKEAKDLSCRDGFVC